MRHARLSAASVMSMLNTGILREPEDLIVHPAHEHFRHGLMRGHGALRTYRVERRLVDRRVLRRVLDLLEDLLLIERILRHALALAGMCAPAKTHSLPM